MLTDAEYDLAKAKLQDRVRRRIEDADTERLRAQVAEYEELKRQVPAAKVSRVDPVKAKEAGEKVKTAQKKSGKSGAQKVSKKK